MDDCSSEVFISTIFFKSVSKTNQKTKVLRGDIDKSTVTFVKMVSLQVVDDLWIHMVYDIYKAWYVYK